MKKLKPCIFYFSFLFFFLIFESCSHKQDNPLPNNGGITLSSNSASFTANSGSYAITISTNGNWTATTSNSWITINPSSGYGNASITIYVTSNSSSSSRSGSVTINSNNLTEIISVNQSGTSGGGGSVSKGSVMVFKPFIQSGTYYTITLQGISDSYNISCGRSSVTDCSALSSCSIAKFTNVPYGTYFVKATGNSGSLTGYVPTWSGNITVSSLCTIINVEQQLD